jgi:hypothetical protein
MPDHAFGRCDAHHEMSVSEVNEMLRLALCLTGEAAMAAFAKSWRRE